MVVGIAAILLFNIIDTLFVGQLGAVELAAMSFTFPVTFIVLSVSMGLGIGATAVISTAIGHGDDDRVRRLTTDGLILANVIVIAFAGTGLWVQAPLFRLLGAEPNMVPLILDYMTPWWWGVGLLVIPMVGNAAIRATGDMVTPSYVMLTSGFVNLILDPLFIFGIGPFPRLELQGAAVATVISWSVTFFAALYFLIVREKMIELSVPRVKDVLTSWRAILNVGLPAAATNVLTPLAGAALTRIVAGLGTPAVAAWGVANRLEGLSLVGVMALSTAVTPFVGQNLGAGRCDRLREAVRVSIGLCAGYGLAVAALLALGAGPIARSFNDDAQVTGYVLSFLWTVPISYTLLGVVQVVGSFFNGSQRPLRAAALSFIRLFVFGLPLAAAGAAVAGMSGLFVGSAVGNVGVGLVAIYMVRSLIDRHEEDLAAGQPPLPSVPAAAAT
ncbi:MAG: MATE family efflux transporter [Myxococcota bacterium]